VRAERSRVGCGRARGPSARQEAIDAYWRGSPNEDSWPEEKVRYDSTWPLARRMEGVRRAMLRPDHYARLAARRLRARTIVAKFGRQPAQEDAAAPEKETANKPAPAWKPPWVPRE
jgi:hypothetical protein